MEGRVKRLVRDRGFGFIQALTGETAEYFFHRSGCTPVARFDELQEGMKVLFEVETSAKGPRATNVREWIR